MTISRDERGEITIRKPVTVRGAGLEFCHRCNGATIVGIYMRVDPVTVPFPTVGDGELARLTE